MIIYSITPLVKHPITDILVDKCTRNNYGEIKYKREWLLEDLSLWTASQGFLDINFKEDFRSITLYQAGKEMLRLSYKPVVNVSSFLKKNESDIQNNTRKHGYIPADGV